MGRCKNYRTELGRQELAMQYGQVMGSEGRPVFDYDARHVLIIKILRHCWSDTLEDANTPLISQLYYISIRANCQTGDSNKGLLVITF